MYLPYLSDVALDVWLVNALLLWALLLLVCVGNWFDSWIKRFTFEITSFNTNSAFSRSIQGDSVYVVHTLHLEQTRHYLLCLMESLSRLLQDLFIKLRVNLEAASLSLHHRTAEFSQTLIQMRLRKRHLNTNRKALIPSAFKCMMSKSIGVCLSYLPLSLFSSLHHTLDKCLHNVRPLWRQAVLRWGLPPQLWSETYLV